jgi:hypothetical protein
VIPEADEESGNVEPDEGNEGRKPSPKDWPEVPTGNASLSSSESTYSPGIRDRCFVGSGLTVDVEGCQLLLAPETGAAPPQCPVEAGSALVGTRGLVAKVGVGSC